MNGSRHVDVTVTATVARGKPTEKIVGVLYRSIAELHAVNRCSWTGQFCNAFLLCFRECRVPTVRQQIDDVRF